MAINCAMADLVSMCSDVIGSTIAARIRELGGTDHDVHQIGTAAAYAVFVWSAGQLTANSAGP